MRFVEYIEGVSPVARTSPSIPDRICRVGPHLSGGGGGGFVSDDREEKRKGWGEDL